MDDEYEAVPLTGVRRVIATRMAEAARTIPHFRLVADIEVDALLSARANLREQADVPAPSINDLLIKACAFALMDVPAVNVQLVDDEIRRYRNAHIAVVTAVNGGLSTPIVRNAESKSVREITREVRHLMSRAARNSLKMEEVFGGTFSISNLGMHGVDEFDAIINAPQCAILAVASARTRVVPASEGNIRLARLMRVTLSADHRAIDGVTAAAFMSALRARLEQPAAWLGELPSANVRTA